MNKYSIIAAIDSKVGSTKCGIWTIGVTDDPDTRKNQHANEGNNVTYWSEWKTDTEKEGREIEKHFLDKGMKGGPGGPGNASYVYVF
jgi:hypothetical protein